MGALTYPFTLTAGQPENVNQLNANLAAISTVINGGIDNTNIVAGANIDGSKLLAASVDGNRLISASVADDRLTSSNLGVWRTVAIMGVTIGAPGAATYVVRSDGQVGGNGSIIASPLAIWPTVAIAAADYGPPSGKTTQLRVRSSIITNNVAPAVTITPGVHPISGVSGNSSGVGITLGAAAVAGALVTPGANAATQAVGSAVSLPADAVYAWGLVVSGSVAANHISSITGMLQMRHV